jgi:hypothetical protein
MALENLISADVIVPLAIFAMPVACLWIKRHYQALEKGLLPPQLGQAAQAQLSALEQRNRELTARVENLESIICLAEGPQKRVLEPTRPRVA